MIPPMKLFYGLSLYLLAVVSAYAQNAGLFQTYAIFSVDGGANSYRPGRLNPDNSPSPLDNTNFGPINSYIVLNGGEAKTYKNNSGDVQGAQMYYRVYKQGTTPSAYILLNLPFLADLGGGNQKWTATAANINLAAGLPSGNYVLNVYFTISATGNTLGTLADGSASNPIVATFGITSTTLPVTLTAFDAKASGYMAGLDWATTSEQGNAYFDVERSKDAQAFERVGRVDGRGTTAVRQAYAFTDESPSRGTNYYRLRQVDADGRFAYSPVRAVQIRTNGELAILGNPASDQFGVVGLETGAVVDLIDLNGQLRTRQSATDGRLHVDVRDLPTGMYLLRVAEPAGVQTKRVLVVH